MKKIFLAVLAMIGIIAAAIGIYLKSSDAMAISVIGGADGPTSVFVAGKITDQLSSGMLAAGVAILITAILIGFYFYKKSHR